MQRHQPDVCAAVAVATHQRSSECHVPNNPLQPHVICDAPAQMLEITKSLVLGQPDDPASFMSAVIDSRCFGKYQPSPPLMMSDLFNARSFDKISGFIQRAKADADVKILVGGKCDNSSGYFISPTILETSNPRSETMVQEIFGPVLTVSTGTALHLHRTILRRPPAYALLSYREPNATFVLVCSLTRLLQVYVYPDAQEAEALELVTSSSSYALTGEASFPSLLTPNPTDLTLQAACLLATAPPSFAFQLHFAIAPETSTSTTSPQEPWLGNSHSVVLEPAEQMIKLVALLSCCGGPVFAASKNHLYSPLLTCTLPTCLDSASHVAFAIRIKSFI